MNFDNVVLIEDDYRGYYPISISTPLSDLIVGGLRYYEHIVLWLMSMGHSADLYVVTRDYLARNWRGTTESLLSRLNLRYSIRYVSDIKDISGSSIMINTSVVPQIDILNRTLNELTPSTEIKCGDRLLIKVVNNTNDLVNNNVIDNCDLPTFSGIWSLIRWNTELLRSNSKYLIRVLGDRSVNSDISRGAIIDERAGNVITIGSSIEPLTYVKGPSLLGPGTRVLPHAYVREGTVLYMDNAVGGEVKNSIMDMHSLKEHFSYLGDSYVGRWVNIGAGSVTSNLKNTIGNIRYMGIDTGMIKLGSIIGDWVKVGINTSIMSGKYIGQGSSIVGLVRDNIPPFRICVNNDCEKLRIDKVIEIYRRFAELRRMSVNENEISLIRAVYDFSLHEASS
ncbi:putative sugar nucleotidyl transferase [Vulcanisaeta souniana]|uniref:Glucose-1-phosphate thymidylyltransferase n=2 Tax=Vulcanisaeta souniana TaxID=164452 RepID=A0A830E423_9CREN|nr:putative sugar nucleotidyl transferase [Vulcanisaeta souniana]BDR92027.1 hypothetical protein Vsou_11200 [Vulcanisaeta souniana JCM 11219]GGI68463.1 hypothetical protein GCM10007112_01850 [Vulcanisaeta souniana JCM 11219]